MRAVVQGIGTPPRVQTISGVMILCVQDRGYGHNGLLAMADPAVVIEPSAVELAEIALATADSVRAMLGVEPVIAVNGLRQVHAEAVHMHLFDQERGAADELLPDDFLTEAGRLPG